MLSQLFKMRLEIISFVLVLISKCSLGASRPPEGDRDWYKTSVLYQVYPRSLKDSDGDGIGDLQGIIQKLDLFIDSGVTAFWLSPIFESPQVDQGYDVSDYMIVDKDYGTNKDLKELIEKSHEAGIKVLLDFVPNHTSDQHAWFNKSVHREEGYDDFYVWADAKVGKEGRREPPNNWVSVFEGSAWKWNDIRKQYFLHQFTAQQPELNYRSENMVKALKTVMRFWLDFGVDGFRVDALPYFYEDEQLRDEPVLHTPGCIPTQYYCLNHTYTRDQQGTFDALYDFRDFIDDYSLNVGGDPRVIITEAYADKEKTLLYYGNNDGSRLGAHYTFNFDLIQYVNYNSRASDLADIINWWQDNLNKTWIRNWVIGNHDNHRVASRLGFPDAYNMLLVGFLPGVSVTYQGDEIAMEDGEVKCEEGQDPKAKNCSTFDQDSRDFERTPYHWDLTKNAGFSDADHTWLPVSKKYLANNLISQNITNIKSHYNLYKECVKFHKKLADESAEVNFEELNSLRSVAIDDTLISYRIFNTTCAHKDPYVFIFNMHREKSVDVKVPLDYVMEYRVEVVNTMSKYNIGDLIKASDRVELYPGDSIILKAECDQYA